MNRIRRIRALECFLIFLAFLWALVLGLPTDLFGNFSVAYYAMANIASENVWSFLITVLGITHLVGMVRNNKKVKQAGLLIATILWFFIGTMIIVSNLLSGVIGVLGGIHIGISIFICAWLYVKVGGQ